MLGKLKKFFKGDKFLLLATGLCTSFLMVVLYVLQPQILRFLDYKIYDQHLRRNHSEKTSGIPVIVDIDEKSLAALGQWPWPRYRVALLLDEDPAGRSAGRGHGRSAGGAGPHLPGAAQKANQK